MSFEEKALDAVYEVATRQPDLICNCRRQDSESDPAGHELWCDIGYGPNRIALGITEDTKRDPRPG
jgi:hypothetical protein